MNKQHISHGPANPVTVQAVPEKTPKRFLRIHEVEALVGFKSAYIYRLIRQKKFPQRIRIGIRAVGWDSEAVNAWIEERMKSSVL
ncbi:helix-turn-helix transcriptional regulator [Saezia sanguinis]|uniref:helix-turn-helix transcriptional regulator n=1 Tax=Saezia sanguinis TaxID=1965230 RepID=UPI0030516C27